MGLNILVMAFLKYDEGVIFKPKGIKTKKKKPKGITFHLK